MDYSTESVRFLHIAYVLMALGQLAYVGFLAKRRHEADRPFKQSRDSDA